MLAVSARLTRRGRSEPLLGLDNGGLLLFAAQGLSGLAMGPFIAFGAIYQRELGATPVEIGLMAALAMGVGMAVMLPGTRLADAYHLRRTILVGWLLTVPAPLFFTFAPHWAFTAVGLALLSASVFNTPALNVYLTLEVARDRVAMVMTTVLSAFSLGLIGSMPLAGWAAQLVGIRWIFLVSFVLFAMASGCVAFLPRRTLPMDATTGVRYRDLLRFPAFMTLVGLFSLLTIIIFLPWTFTPLYAQEVAHTTDFAIGALMAILYLGSVAMGLALSRLRRTIGCLVMILCFELAYIGSAILLLSSTSLSALALAFFLRGAFWSFRQVMTAVIGEVLPNPALAKGYGFFALVSGGAAALAYPVGGWMYARQPGAPFWASALFMAAAVMATILLRDALRPTRRARVTTTVAAQPERLPEAA